MQLFTIGHSNHPIEVFLQLLTQHGVTALADVRSAPYSRRFPQFNQNTLKYALRAEDIAYVFLGDELGARPKDPDCYVQGKALYERIAATSSFADGIERIFTGARHHQIALMCAEQDPATCHRAILVCKYLQEGGLDVQHILKNGSLESHQNLEHRLLKLHHLGDPLPISSHRSQDIQQLDLFGSLLNPENPTADLEKDPVSLKDLIEQAYQLQSDKIAYSFSLTACSAFTRNRFSPLSLFGRAGSKGCYS